jgi:hypothetical protein
METFTLYLKLAGLTLAFAGAILLAATLLEMLMVKAHRTFRNLQGEELYIKSRFPTEYPRRK